MKTISNLRYASRSVITDKIYNEDKKNQYQRHANKLLQIKEEKRVPKFYEKRESLPYLDTNRNSNQQDFHIKRIQQSKKAAKKIREIFDQTELQNKSLWNKLQKIHLKKSQSVSHFQMGGSRMKSNFRQLQRQKQIKDFNRKMIDNILIEKGKLSSKDQLRKQFKQYEQYKNLHLKIKREGDQRQIKKKKTKFQQPQMNLYTRDYQSNKNKQKKQQIIEHKQLEQKKKSKKKKNSKKYASKKQLSLQKSIEQKDKPKQKENQQQKIAQLRKQ